MKTIGVLGGTGPQATIDFEARLHRVSQQLIPPQNNSGYPGLVVFYFRELPSIPPGSGPSPWERLRRPARGRSQGIARGTGVWAAGSRLPPAHGSMAMTRSEVNPRMQDAAKKLGGLADFLAIPCNGAHIYFDQLAQAAGGPVLNMIDASVAEVQRRGLRRVGILNFRPAGDLKSRAGVRQAGA